MKELLHNQHRLCYSSSLPQEMKIHLVNLNHTEFGQMIFFAVSEVLHRLVPCQIFDRYT